MSLEALKQILRRADASAAALFNADEVAAWPAGSLETLTSLGLLREDAPARVIICPGCDMQCLKEVNIVGEGDETRAVIYCDQRDDMEPIEIPLERLRRWSVDVRLLANVLALSLGGSRQAEERVSGRLWWLGRVPVGETRGDVFLARGIRWGDSEGVFGQSKAFRGSLLPVVLTLSQASAQELGERTGVVSVSRILSLENGRLRLDTGAMAQAVRLVSTETTAAAANVFRCDGATWTVTFAGLTKTFDDTKGMRYIAFLLEHQGEESHVLELAQQVDGAPPPDPRYSRTTTEQLEREGIPIEDRTSQRQVMDGPYEQDVRAKVQGLQEKRDLAESMGDDKAAEAVQSEIEEYLSLLASGIGRDGRHREFADSGEHARQRVQKAIYSSLRAIKRDHPELHTHLKASMLPLGYTVSYKPAAPVDWSF